MNNYDNHNIMLSSQKELAGLFLELKIQIEILTS
jgi:hypothetical protein